MKTPPSDSYEDPKFAPVGEVPITRAIVDGFARDFSRSIESDVLIVGSGPSGLVAAMDLARDGFNVAIVEETNYLGGGFWMGGYLMNKVTVRKPGHTILVWPLAVNSTSGFTVTLPVAPSILLTTFCITVGRAHRNSPV